MKKLQKKVGTKLAYIPLENKTMFNIKKGVYMIDASSITKVYVSLLNKEITKENAINKLIVLVLENPHFFGLENLNKEDMQDFLFYFIQKVDKVFNNFNPEKSKFSSYFQSHIRFALESWRKYLGQYYTKSLLFTNDPDYDFFESNNEYAYSPEHNLESSISETEPIYYPQYRKNQKQTELTELEILIITLKSSYYISNEHIERILNNVSISKFQLLNYIKNLNEKMIDKICRKNKLVQLVNQDYVKLRVLKNKINDAYYNSTKQQILKNQYKVLKKRRSQRIERLKKIKIIPSDTEISKLLNISTAKIRYLLKKNYRVYNIKVLQEKIS